MVILRVSFCLECVFPENTHPDPTEGHWEFYWRGERGEGVVGMEISKAKHLKAKYGVKLELLEG